MLMNNEDDKPVTINSPRKTIELILPDGRVFTGPRGATLLELLSMLPEWENPPIMGAIVNGELKELTYPIDMDAKIRPVTMADDDGARIYRRSATFLLEAAFEEIFPENSMKLDHSVSAGGYYCEVTDRAPLSPEELKTLEKRMQELVDLNLKIKKKNVPLKKAISYFEEKGLKDKVQLLKYRQKDYLVLYQLGNHQDYHHGYMVPSTSFIKWFALDVAGDGFILSYPRRNSPKQILTRTNYPKLLSTFRQYGNWLERLGIESVGSLNDANSSGNLREVILISGECTMWTVLTSLAKLSSRSIMALGPTAGSPPKP